MSLLYVTLSEIPWGSQEEERSRNPALYRMLRGEGQIPWREEASRPTAFFKSLRGGMVRVKLLQRGGIQPFLSVRTHMCMSVTHMMQASKHKHGVQVH